MADSAENVRLRRFQSSIRAGGARVVFSRADGLDSYTVTSWSAYGYGNGFSTTVSTSENTAVVMPAPKASVSTAETRNAGRLVNDLHACRHAAPSRNRPE